MLPGMGDGEIEPFASRTAPQNIFSLWDYSLLCPDLCVAVAESCVVLCIATHMQVLVVLWAAQT